jgi:hypothetical protein
MPRETPARRPVLAHRLHGPPDVYRLTTIDLPEVTTGTVATEVPCGACGQPVSCIVESPRARIRRRRRLRLTFYAVFILGVPAAMAGLALLFEPADVRGAVGVGIVFAVSFGVTGSAIGSVWAEVDSEHDGEEGLRLPRRHRPHSVRHLKDLSEDSEGNWHGPAFRGGSGDCNGEPLTDWSL